MRKMIKTECLKKAIMLAIASAYLKNEKSFSMLIIAKPESGKTYSLMEFAENDGIVLISDMTYAGIIELLPSFNDNKLRTILIPDMLKIFGKNINISQNFITLLNEFIEEGVVNIKTYHTSTSFDSPVRGNVIAAVTSTDFFRQKRYWGRIGFITRVIPFSYSYSIDDVEKIFKHIIEDKDDFKLQKLKKMKDRSVEISPSLSNKLRSVTSSLTTKFMKLTDIEVYGFRYQKHLQVMAKSHALLDGRNKVTIKDVNALLKLSNWFNYDFNPL